VHAGEKIALVGASGSGKTTLLRVLSGQIVPQAGAVLFNDLNLTQLSSGFRARNIAYVSQQPLFIYGSIAQNLRLVDPFAEDQKLLSVLDEMGLGPWVSGLPDGIDTRLDPTVDGALLSSSVLTSLSVAQALLSAPRVLLLDEPAGNMDVELETKLVEALERRRGQMTSVVVTYRPSLIHRADKVIILNAGTAVMRDTAELARQVS
jgi:ABC-type bacteriocin/lantibiotic exporter with double-glycine peptidase domain